MNAKKKLLTVLMATLLTSGLSSKTMYDYNEDPNLPLGINRTPDPSLVRAVRGGPNHKRLHGYHGPMMKETPLEKPQHTKPKMHQKGFVMDEKTQRKIIRKLAKENVLLRKENIKLKERMHRLEERMFEILRNTTNR